MDPKALRAVAIAIAVVGSIPTKAEAVVIGHGDRINFLAAAAGLTLTEDPFANEIPGALQIVFDSGVVSLTGPGPSYPSNFNSVVPAPEVAGFYNNIISNSEPIVSQSVTWTFPTPILGFGFDMSVHRDGLQLSFGGEDFFGADIPGDDNEFIGFLSTDPFQTLVFSTVFPMGGQLLALDNLVFASDPNSVPVPLPSSLSLILAGLGGLAALGGRIRTDRRRQEEPMPKESP